MNTVGKVSSTTSYQAAAENGTTLSRQQRDEESATLLSFDENVSTSKSSSSNNNNGVSLKTVAYGLGVVALAPDAERFAAVARPTIGALGAGAFVAAAALAAYVGSRRQSES